MTSDCVFCRIVAREEPATIVRYGHGAIAIVPLKPIVPGHLLVISTEHVADFTEQPHVSANVIHFAANVAYDMGPCNLITSKGIEATQSVFHLHLHLVPRRANDGLALPWYSGKLSEKERRDLANAHRDEVVPGSGIAIEPWRHDE